MTRKDFQAECTTNASVYLNTMKLCFTVTEHIISHFFLPLSFWQAQPSLFLLVLHLVHAFLPFQHHTLLADLVQQANINFQC